MEGEARAALINQMPRIVARAKVPPLFLNKARADYIDWAPLISNDILTWQAESR